ncbi:hypothetical protein CR513_46542, partial [Mucuna pruriens]
MENERFIICEENGSSYLTTYKPKSMSDEECDFEHQHVCGFIHHFVDDNVHNHIASETHARTLWEKIEFLYASKCGNNKLFLLNSIVSLKFKEGAFLSDYLNEFQRILDQMSRMGIKSEDEIFGLLLLNSLSESWETFKVSITNSTFNSIVYLQMAKNNVLNKEMKRKAQGSSSWSKVQECGVHYYHRTTDIQKHCFLWEKENKGKKGKSKKKDHDDYDDHVTTPTSDNLTSSRLILYPMRACELLITVLHYMLHQGRSYLHLTPRKEFFTSYTLGDFGVLKMGNDSVSKVISVCNV